MGFQRRARLPDPRRAKIHHNYTIAEVASLFGVHRNTVRHWIKRGLGVVTIGRTALILGSELRDYLKRARGTRRTACGPGAMYCMRCRAARTPPPELVEVATCNVASLNLRGMCPDCGSLMHRRCSSSGLAPAGFGFLLATLQHTHLVDSPEPSVNCTQTEAC